MIKASTTRIMISGQYQFPEKAVMDALRTSFMTYLPPVTVKVMPS